MRLTAKLLRHILLPAVTLSFPALASIIRVNRAEMLETLKQDYITNARAQGRATYRIVGLYALRNAMLPTMAMIEDRTVSATSAATEPDPWPASAISWGASPMHGRWPATEGSTWRICVPDWCGC